MLWKIVISWPTRERISWVVATKVFPLDGRKHRCAEAELAPLSLSLLPTEFCGGHQGMELSSALARTRLVYISGDEHPGILE